MIDLPKSMLPSDVTIVAAVRDHMPTAACDATQCGCRLSVASEHAVEFIRGKFFDISTSFGHTGLPVLTSWIVRLA
jgi:hypothetical protein